MEEDSLFNLDVVRDFIIDKGGKTTNHALVTHFKTYLNDPVRKVLNRQKFKEIVNTLAVVKLDEQGEKVLQLKRKYRSDAPVVTASPVSATGGLPKNRPKAKKAKMAEQFESSMVSEASSTPGKDVDLSMGAASSIGSPTSDDQPRDSEPSLSDMISGALGSIGLESEQKDEFHEEESRSYEPVESPDDQDQDQSSQLPMVEEEMIAEEPADAAESFRPETPPVIAAAAEIRDEDVDGSVVSVGLDSGVGEGSSQGDGASSIADSRHGGSMDTVSMASSEGQGPVTEGNTAGAHPIKRAGEEADERSFSVRQRLQHLEKIESQSNLLSPSAGKKSRHHSKAAGAEDEDSTSETSMTVSLSDAERKWMVDAAQANYQELAKALHTTPKLSKYKDFISGYTALHWAAKHGNSDIIKLVCGSTEGTEVNAQTHGGYTALHLASQQGHEDIIELLVQGYKADPDIRDYGGRKPKQYLKHSASTRSQQLLQPRRIRTANIATGNQQTAFRRIGSYNSKIRSVGGAPFGIQGGAAMRKSWTDAGESRSTSASPGPSPRQSPGPSPRQSPGELRRMQDLTNQAVMPPPQGVPLRRHRSRRADSRENLSDSEMTGHVFPPRSGSDSDLVIQTETGL